MPKIKEMRCPDCGALYNVEACSERTHGAIDGRRAERKEIIQDMREKTNSIKGSLGREEEAGREALHEYATFLENKK